LAAYVLQRLLAVAAAMAGVAALTFVVFHVLPSQAPPAGDGPLPVQLAEYLERVFLHLDLGRSTTGTQRPVADLLAAGLPGTLSLLFGAMALSLGVGVAVGVLRATHPRSVAVRVVDVVIAVALIAPPYWLGLIALLALTTESGLVDVPFLGGQGSYRGLTEDPGRWLQSLLLPWMVLGAAFIALNARMLGGTLRETLGDEYVRTARAKGVSERRIVWRHALPPALPSLLAVASLNVALFVNGAVVVETVFNVPGVGRLARDSLLRNDLPVLEGTVLLGAALVCLAGLLADAIHAWLDPQVRFGGEAGR
jgi:peptide/nickel transport system permease protein